MAKHRVVTKWGFCDYAKYERRNKYITSRNFVAISWIFFPIARNLVVKLVSRKKFYLFIYQVHCMVVCTKFVISRFTRTLQSPVLHLDLPGHVWTTGACAAPGRLSIPKGAWIHLDHRVGRVLGFFSSRRNWDSPSPSPAGECAPPPPVLRGGAHSLARESQFRRGGIHCGTFSINVLCAPGQQEPIYAAPGHVYTTGA